MISKKQHAILEGVSVARVAEAAERAMRSSARYQDIRMEMSTSEATWQVVVKPNWYMLPTRMLGKAMEHPGGTIVHLETKSQFYVLGDVFGFYDRYISDLFLEMGFILGVPPRAL
jgi:hypothetical protein